MFYGLDAQNLRIMNHTIGIISSLYKRVFHADHLITVERAMGFSEDAKFQAAMERCAENEQDRSLSWRLHTLTWAAGQCLQLPGDYVECGVYKGFCSHFLVEYLDFGASDKRLFLYDTYEGIPEQHSEGSPLKPGDYDEQGLHQRVLDRFKAWPNVQVVKGVVPDSLLESCPEQIAYLHLDMNSASAEVGALEALFDRIVPGGMIVLDDYGWHWFRAQKEAEDVFFAERGYRVLELPTGQGLVVKR